jgi:hypothetical protein
VTEERRADPRIKHPFDGARSGASGANRCRIGDISIGGCFVQSLAAPAIGEPTTVTVTFGEEHSMSFKGKALYVEDAIGFAVKFNELAARDRATLKQFLEALQGA